MESEVQYSYSPPSYTAATAQTSQQHPSAIGQAPNNEHPYDVYEVQHVALPAPPTCDYPRSTPYPTAGPAPSTYPAPASGPAPPQYSPPPAQYPPPPPGQAPYTQPYGQPQAGAPPQPGYGTPKYHGSAPSQQQQQQQVVVLSAAGKPQPVIAQQVKSYSGHIAYACLVFWCCNPLFGLVAFILAG